MKFSRENLIKLIAIESLIIPENKKSNALLKYILWF